MAGLSEIKEALGDIHPGKILYDEPMTRHTSLQVGGIADAVVVTENEDQLINIVRRLKERQIPFLAAGNLTNILVRDGGYRGAILLMRGLDNILCGKTGAGANFISAQAGVALAKVVHCAMAEELTGVEFCAGIPGSIGGAVWMNAGAYGKEMKDVIESLLLLNANGEKRTMKRGDIPFTYRNSNLPDGVIILEAQLKLEKGQSDLIKERVNDILKLRQEKHPLNYPNAGSIFKNPPGEPAGKIIEELGLKGVNCGGAHVSSKHANFIINKGQATATNVLELIALIQTKARDEKGLVLETEVIIIGEDE